MTAPQPVAEADWADATWPLGAHVDPTTGDTTFTVASPQATRVTLELFPRAQGADADASIPLVRGADGLWRARVSDARHGALPSYDVPVSRSRAST